MPLIRQRYILISTLLVTLGILFLLNNFNAFSRFDIDWFWLLWPLNLILLGVYFLFRGKKISSYITSLNAFIAGIVLFGFLVVLPINIPFLPKIETRKKSSINPNIEFNTETERFNNNIQKASLIFRSQRGNFLLRGNTNSLTEYESKSTFGVYQFERSTRDGIETVDLRFNQERFPWRLTAETNSLDLKLNANPIWDLDYEIQTSSTLDLDLSYYKVSKVRLNSSSSETKINITNSTIQDELNLMLLLENASRVSIRIPKEVGIEILNNTTFSLIDLSQFNLIEGETNIYRSDNFDTASKKVIINANSRLSAINFEIN
jgi:hypothetical protein